MDIKISPLALRIRIAAFAISACTVSGWATISQADDAFAVDSRWMTGDWGGLRTELLEKGVDLKMGYVGESASNLRGGYEPHHHVTRYSDQFTLGLSVDLEKLAGWEETKFSLALSNRNGSELDEITSDPRAKSFNATQEINGRGSVTRIGQLWLSKGWLDDKINLKAGRYAVSDEFAAEDCVFQNLAFCGSQPGNYVDSIHNGPISQWAARLRYRITDEIYTQIGAYNVNPSNLDNDNGLKVNVKGTTGTLVPVELVWTPSVNQLPGEYRVGYYHSTAGAPDVYKDINNQPAAITGADYRTNSSRHGSWVVAKQQLTSVAGDTSRGLTVVASATFMDRASTPVDSYQKVALLYKGLFDIRPADTIGFGAARIHGSSRFLRNAKTANEQSGATFEDAGYVPEQHTMYVAELNYRAQVTGWLSVLPNLQYLKNPDGQREVDNTWVAGLQVQTQF
ncbi:MAG TPA: carbohydrate porin [Pseudomonas sp.]|uniref:carbohydrate porin n=1 Tax=Pseudomonas sp. TaxID=306 RepID=UPI002B49B942|nr:carbohydrate porin [Pseudomonas sp.]HKS15626.1 carbohydrate porin [Pseudomonas sp.]